MKNKYVLGVIGAGFMSSAIINGILKAKVLKKSQIIVSDLNDAQIDKMNKLGVKAIKDNYEVAENCDYLLLAIKPQNFDEVAILLKKIRVPVVISIMAGVKKDKIRSYFKNSKIVRCMPNTPCSIGQGAVGIDMSELKDDCDINFVTTMFSAFSSVSIVDESKINAVTGVSGSSPAYFYYIIKSLVDSAIKHGLDYETALNLAVNTMVGAGKMILSNKDKSLEELINAVCSKGGTTIEAIKVFDQYDISNIIDMALTACVNRSKELEENL